MKTSSPIKGVTISDVFNSLALYRLPRRESSRPPKFGEIPLVMIQSAIASRKQRKRGHMFAPRERAKRKRHNKACLLLPIWRGRPGSCIWIITIHTGSSKIPRDRTCPACHRARQVPADLCSVWALRPVLRQNPPDEVGTRHTMCRRNPHNMTSER
jgi:hypothetical protein